MRHTIVVHLRNSTVLHGYYRSESPGTCFSGLPTDLPQEMTIDPADGGPSIALNIDEAKAIFFVHSFAGMPAQHDVRFFDTSDVHPYLWIRMTFTDGEVMEGRVANGIELLKEHFFRLFPVDELNNNRCLFVPKRSVDSFQVIGMLEEQTQLMPQTQTAAVA